MLGYYRENVPMALYMKEHSDEKRRKYSLDSRGNRVKLLETVAHIAAANVYYSFHDTPRGGELQKKISGILKGMKAGGDYEKVLNLKK